MSHAYSVLIVKAATKEEALSDTDIFMMNEVGKEFEYYRILDDKYIPSFLLLKDKEEEEKDLSPMERMQKHDISSVMPATNKYAIECVKEILACVESRIQTCLDSADTLKGSTYTNGSLLIEAGHLIREDFFYGSEVFNTYTYTYELPKEEELKDYWLVLVDMAR